MSSQKDSFLWRYKWHVITICVTLTIVVLLTWFTDIFRNNENRQFVFLFGSLIFLSALLAMASKLFKILEALQNNSTKLEEVAGALEKIHSGLTQINHSARISDAAKAIAFREADIQSLREAVFEKIHEQDFDAAEEMISEIAKRPEYHELADELRVQAEKYRTATAQERANQVIAHINKLFEEHKWARASVQIEGLIKMYPESEQAKAMRHILFDKKQERKKILLAAWDDAVQNQETDRSLEILKELDTYLTPNEGLALQEAARDVFRTKLHNLGMQFSIAVTEKQWTSAYDIGQQIIKDFPNSKMSKEILGKLDVLKQNVQMQSS